jgi:two-component system chemotaxis sensor kinase CheA
MIRNSIEHGIEPPEARTTAGKPETGTIRLSAEYEGGNVLIRLADDGAGINTNRIKEKAVKKKLVDAATADGMPESEIINLIFQPGFSTSDIITDLSGRGVGMDVARTNIIEDLKGSIQISSEPGSGTTFSIRLPLTMAIVHVLFIRVSTMTFAVPANYVEEIIRHKTADIIDVMDKQAVRLREQLIPLVHLGVVLNLPPAPGVDPEARTDQSLIMIASVGSEKLGVIIEALLDEEDMVIKPLPAHLKRNPLVTGCIISGKNEIFSVLNMPKIIESAKEFRERQRMETAARTEKKEIHILVVDDSVTTREIEKSILESYGYHVSLAEDGAEGMTKAKSRRFDLVISDVEMPRIDGFSFTQQLRADQDYQDTPIILITTRDSEADKKRGIKAGADAYILKGTFDQDTLLDTVQNLVG